MARVERALVDQAAEPGEIAGSRHGDAECVGAKGHGVHSGSFWRESGAAHRRSCPTANFHILSRRRASARFIGPFLPRLRSPRRRTADSARILRAQGRYDRSQANRCKSSLSMRTRRAARSSRADCVRPAIRRHRPPERNGGAAQTAREPGARRHPDRPRESQPRRFGTMFTVSRTVRRPVAMFVDHSDAAMIEAAVDAGVSAYIVDGLRKERVKAILDMAVSRFNAFDRLRRELAEAKDQLAERKVIDRAKGILMKAKSISGGRGLRVAAQHGDERKSADRRGRAIGRHLRRGCYDDDDACASAFCRWSTPRCWSPRAKRDFAEAEGLSLDLVREASWANLRDRLSVGCSTRRKCSRRPQSPQRSGSGTCACRWPPRSCWA